MVIVLVVSVSGYTSKGPGFDSRRYQIFWEVVGLEWGPLSLVSTTEGLLGRNSSGSGLENREDGHGDPLRWPRDTLYPQKSALTSPTSGDRSVGIVRLRAKGMKFVCLLMVIVMSNNDNNWYCRVHFWRVQIYSWEAGSVKCTAGKNQILLNLWFDHT
jgi:hypothetical protein